AFALKTRHFSVATAGFFLLAVQSAFFSPAKTGILKELVGSARLALASGWLQMLAIIGILTGSLLGGLAYEKSFNHLDGDTWGAAFIPTVTICAFSVGAILAGHCLRRTPAAGASRFHPTLLVQHFQHLGALLKPRPMRLTVFGIAFFWFAGAFAQLLVIQVGIGIANGPEQAAAISGKLQAYVGIGIATGSLLVALLSSQRIELGIVPVGGAGLAISSAVAALSPQTSAAFELSLGFIGLSGALFLVPLTAFLQDLADPSHRGRVLSASGLVDSLACLAGIGVQHLLVLTDVSVTNQLLFLSLLSLAASIYIARLLPTNLIRFLVLTAFRIFYRITPVNHHKIPKTGGALLLPNHLSYLDAIVLSAACSREIRFVIFDHYYKNPLLRPLLKLFGVVPISPNRAKDAVRAISSALADGALICLFPEGQLTRTGCLNEIKKGFELMARKSAAPVVPAFMDGIWGSVFSFERGRFKKKFPHHLPVRIRVFFGDPIPARQASTTVVRQAITQLSADALDSRPQLDTTLAAAIARSLHRKSWKTSLVEYAGRRPTALSRAAVYASAVSLGERWSQSINSDRVAVVLPESSTAVLVHLGLIFAGKTPVSVPLNNPAGPGALR
ncbi:MAG: MFS transporter, partial [Verrucomicrobiales bacterium]|nr:MFS transporter [Verrucomicrobiales bacterium]